MFTLLVKRDKRVDNYARLAQVIDGIGDRIVNVGGGGGNWSGAQKQENVDAVVGVLEATFRDRKAGEDAALDSWVTQFENILTQSFTEYSLYDFKQGFYTLGKPPEFDESAFDKVLETLTAMANHGSGIRGYVIVGVADKERHAARVHEVHGVDSVEFRGFYVTGVGHEATLRGESLDAYVRWITDKINSSGMNSSLRTMVTSEMRLVRYHDKAVLILPVKAQSEPFPYGDRWLRRSGSSTVEVQPASIGELFSRFP